MKRGRPRDRREHRERRAHRRAGLLLFLTALALRLLFWQATPDAAWPHSVEYKGDAPTWVAYAQSLRAGTDFELGLPLRPPGAGYLLAAVWDGDGDLWPAQALWCILGALTVLLCYGAVLRSFGFAMALITGLLCALSHGLMMLSTSLNNETPYLFLVACTFYLWPGRVSGTAWGTFHALACLVRVEHLLVFLLSTAWLLAAQPRRVRRRCAVHVCLAFALVLLPWHVTAWSAIERFNRLPPAENTSSAAAQARLEQALAHVEWTAAAAAERDRMPAFARRAAANFVAATVVYRRGPVASDRPPVVDIDDLSLLEQAFTSRPEPLPAHPFITFYGGLNFHLAHNPWAEPGFSRRLLDQPPLLEGSFPSMLVNGLPPPDLAFTYPPHLQVINHGYANGLEYIASEPATTARRLAQRALIFWDGAALGLGGNNLPFGTDGIRRRADLAVPTGATFRGWQMAWLMLVAAGLSSAVSSSRVWPLAPWLALAATKLLVGLAFFGYARHGAGTFPVFALLAALAISGLGRRFGIDLDTDSRRKNLLAGAAVVCLAFVALEAWRFVEPPSLALDGRAVGVSDPWPIEIHEERRLIITD